MELTKLPISLVMIVHNSGGRLKDVISAHREFVSEVIVVDQSSTDGTYEEALELADLVVRRTCKGTADPDRNFAFSLANNPWVLYLDDDEKLDKAAIESLPRILESGANIVWFGRRNYVDGIDLTAEIGKDPQCRLFNKGAVEFPDQIHTYPAPAPGALVLYSNEWINHYRTLEGLKKANKARERIAGPEAKKAQTDFIARVEQLLKDHAGFNDNWYSNEQLDELRKVALLTSALEGTVVEIGCWEGKSTCQIANTLTNDTVIAVDTWQGNYGEGEDHPSVVKAKERDVYKTFLSNVAARTKGNVTPVKADCFEYLSYHISPIKFCHIDASHDYDSVIRTIKMVEPLMVRGGVICGDDFQSANAQRHDLDGGVERAVRESLPGFKSVGNLWYWIKQ